MNFYSSGTSNFYRRTKTRKASLWGQSFLKRIIFDNGKSCNKSNLIKNGSQVIWSLNFYLNTLRVWTKTVTSHKYLFHPNELFNFVVFSQDFDRLIVTTVISSSVSSDVSVALGAVVNHVLKTICAIRNKSTRAPSKSESSINDSWLKIDLGLMRLPKHTKDTSGDVSQPVRFILKSCDGLLSTMGTKHCHRILAEMNLLIDNNHSWKIIYCTA